MQNCISEDCKTDGVRVSLLVNGGKFKVSSDLNNKHIQLFDSRILNLLMTDQEIKDFFGKESDS